MLLAIYSQLQADETGRWERCRPGVLQVSVQKYTEHPTWLQGWFTYHTQDATPS